MPIDNLNAYAIVADIGGTFARFCRVQLNTLSMDKIEIYPCAEYPSLESVLSTYKKQQGLEAIKQVALAIACPVLDDEICMTNIHWRFSISELKEKLGLTELLVLNDFNAVAMSLPVLSADETRQVGGGLADPEKTRVVLGAGTGLGVAFLSTGQEGYYAHAGEGGHMSWGAKNEQEWFIHCYLQNKYEHVSYERLLSGHGLENLYEALLAFNQSANRPMPASDIIPLALSGDCPVAEASVAQFLAILGAYAGDLALAFSCFGGVYIAGGIVPRLMSLLEQSEFRSRFEEKGRFRAFNGKIPTYVITAEQPGLLGAAVHLKQLRHQ